MKLRNDGYPFELFRVPGVGIFEKKEDAELAARGKGEWGTNLDVYPETFIHAMNWRIYRVSGALQERIVPAGLTDKVKAAKSKLTQEELDALAVSLRKD